MSDSPLGPGYWQASDGKWYPPESAPGTTPPPAPGFNPAYGAPTGAAGIPGPLASWGQRATAILLDWGMILVAYIALFIVVFIAGAIADILGALVGLVGYLGLAAYSFYTFYMQGQRGGTPGKRLLGLKVVGEQTGQPIGGGLGIVRQLAHFLDGIICYIGYLLPLWDEKRQTIADKVMKTVVLTNQPKEAFGPEIFKL